MPRRKNTTRRVKQPRTPPHSQKNSAPKKAEPAARAPSRQFAGKLSHSATARRAAASIQKAKEAAHAGIRMKARLDAARAQFVSTEVDLALTFCNLATSSGNPADSERRIGHAIEAYHSAVHYLQEMDPSEGIKSEIWPKLEQLKQSLEKIGQQNPNGPAAKLMQRESSAVD